MYQSYVKISGILFYGVDIFIESGHTGHGTQYLETLHTNSQLMGDRRILERLAILSAMSAHA
jgi:hypothetical protein